MSEQAFIRRLRSNLRRAWVGGFLVGGAAGVFAGKGMWTAFVIHLLVFSTIRLGIWVGNKNALTATQTVAARRGRGGA